jgi:hypothetical protein
MRIVAIDPGKTTGMTLVTFRSGETIFESSCQVKQDKVWISLDNYKADVIVLEKFIGYPKVKMDFTPVEVMGIVREWCRQHDIDLVEQTPSQAKHYYTDVRLKERELYIKGMPHANDAMRHALYYLEVTRKEGIRAKAPTHPSLNDVVDRSGSHLRAK